MELANIFKMEMYKNLHNRPYLWVIAILAAMAIAATTLGILMIEGVIDAGGRVLFILVPLIIFGTIGLAVFSLLYPFHLLNVDYRNRVMSLIFASGVSREKYYFVKIGATILTFLIALSAILFIPIIAFVAVYTQEFVEIVQVIFRDFAVVNVFPFLLSSFFSLLAFFFILTTSVIITKGKVAGIFLYFGFAFALSTLQSIVMLPFFFANVEQMIADGNNINHYLYVGMLFSIAQIIGFALLGLYVLRKQDL
jgi:hypothetical protein